MLTRQKVRRGSHRRIHSQEVERGSLRRSVRSLPQNHLDRLPVSMLSTTSMIKNNGGGETSSVSHVDGGTVKPQPLLHVNSGGGTETGVRTGIGAVGWHMNRNMKKVSGRIGSALDKYSSKVNDTNTGAQTSIEKT